MEQVIKLSVVVVTYNQELYVRQCLESILKQKVNFEYEIVLGDDASTDQTVKIIEQIMQEYPGKIRLFVNKENLGASKNIYNLLLQSRGEYFTRLEGDDYWELTDELQKSIDFLDEHKEYIGISRTNKIYSEAQGKIRRINHINIKKYKVGTYDTWKRAKAFGTPLCRNFYRQNEDFSVIYKSARMVAENALGFLIASRGDVYLTDEAWEVKRTDRIQGASNYNSLYSSVEIYTEQVESWQVISRMYPGYDLTFRKRRPMQGLFYACKSSKNMAVFNRYLQKFDLQQRCIIWLKILSHYYFLDRVTIPFIMVRAKISRVLRKG